jgi:hypothetical protein
MKSTIFYSLFFLFVLSANKVHAQQDPDLKYNKAKKEFRESHPGTQQKSSAQTQSTTEANGSVPAAPDPKSKKGVETKAAVISKGLKNQGTKTP